MRSRDFRRVSVLPFSESRVRFGAAAMSSPPPDGFDDDATRAAVKELNALCDEWCERPRCARVRAADVIPDLTNRENTGVSWSTRTASPRA